MLLSALGWAWACGGLRSHFSNDGGGDSGPSGSDGGGGTDAGSGTDGGGGSDSGSGMDSGSNSDGGLGGGGFTWTAMTTETDSFDAISGTGSGGGVVLYASYSARLRRYQSGTWADVYQDTSNANILGLWVSSDQEVFAGASTELIACTSNCTSQAAFTSYPEPILSPTGVCGLDAQHVYAAGIDGSNIGHLYQWDAGSPGWDDLGAPPSWVYFANCWVAPNGAVFIGAQSNIVRYDTSGFTAEHINWPGTWQPIDIANQTFQAVGGDGTNTYATGYQCRIFSRDGSGNWNLLFDPGTTNCAGGPFYGIAMDSDGGGIAAGVSTAGADALLSGGNWAYDPNSPTLFTALSLWVASPTEYYMAGGPTNDVTGIIYRGTR